MARLFPGVAAALLAAAAAATPLPAQYPWVASYYPYLLKGPNDKTALIIHWQYAQLADYDQPFPYNGSLSIEGGANADGGRFLIGRFKGPHLVQGWRFSAEAGVEREARFGFFGLGNNGVPAGGDIDPHYDRMRRTRLFGRADATRWLAGPLGVSVGGSFTDAAFSALPGESRFALHCDPDNLSLLDSPLLPRDQNGVCADDSDLLGRIALILDTRDNEFVPTTGVLLEAGALAGTGGEGYSGVYGVAQGFVTPRLGTTLGLRVLARRLGEGAPVDARYTLPAWERAIELGGGPGSNRAYLNGRWAGREVVILNAEVRQDILDLGDYGAFTVIGFFDAIRAREDFTGESDGFRPGGGAALAVRILRSTVLSFNWAWGDDGFRFGMGTGWAF